MKMRISCLLLLLFSFITSTWAQNATVTGSVMKQSGDALVGATVNVKGTTTSTTTDEAGHFTIKVPNSNATLVITHVGYTAETVAIGGKTSVTVVLKEETSTLNDVVVIGYGKVKKKDLTGTVAVLSGKDLAKTPVASLGEAMTGKMSGVQVTTTEGSPDADITIRVRGGNSITQNNSPLYVVDGFIQNSISNISPSDIESISALKDAATTAIYGAAGANGVIIVTTKEGKVGKITTTGNAYGGAKYLAKELNVLSPYEYVRYQYEIDQSKAFQDYYGAFQDLDIYKSVKGTDWQDKLFGSPGTVQYYNVGVNGGTKATRFNLSATHNDEKSIMLGSGYQRSNISFKLNTELSKAFSVDFNTRMAYTVTDGAGVSSGSGSTTRLRNAVKYAPTRGLREFGQGATEDDDALSPESSSLLFDPIQSIKDEYKKKYQLSSNFNAALNWNIIPGLVYRLEGNYEFINTRIDNVWGPATSNAKNYGGQPIAQLQTVNDNNWRIVNTLNYDFSKLIRNEDHSLTAMLGQESFAYRNKYITNESRFFPAGMSASDVLAMMNLGTPIPTITKIMAPNHSSSYFGRANYSYKDKYLFSATFRTDGTSLFGPGNKSGYYPAIAGAWRISKEDFFNVKWIQDLKFRASYGTVGNNKVPAGMWLLTYTTANENKPYFPGETEAPQLIPSSTLVNPDLGWETTITRNIGFDYTLLHGKLSGSIDGYWNTTKDLIVDVPVPTSSGYLTTMRNQGRTGNRGIELNLDAVIVKNNDFSLSGNVNISRNWNKVEEYKNGDANWKTFTSGWNGTAAPLEDYIVMQGHSVGLMYGYVTEGMYSFDDFTFDKTSNTWKLNPGVASNAGLTSSNFGPGALKFKDISGPDGKPDGKIDNYDKTIIGCALPKFTGGFGLNASYKGFDFSTFFNFTLGNDVYNANKIDYSTFLLSRKYQNLISDMDLAHRFTVIDPVTGLNVATGKYANPERLQEINQNATIWSPIMTLTPLHSWAIEDGSFLRLNTMTLGYTLPKEVVRKIRLNNLRVYVTGYNLHVWTNYSGFDPEVDTRRSTPVTPGVDYSAYPKSRSFVAGINVTF